uniref:Sun n=1 Tax=Puccinia cf. psidii AE-2014 TaxID=1505670 RepID=A0A060IN00_9BASI|nr:Sun [Puccinia cf. psidii AE-2014]
MGKPRRNKQNRNQTNPINLKKSNQRWDALPATNLAFVEYYKNQQKIVSSDQEWDELFKAFRTDLPTTFRITGGKKLDLTLNKIIEETYLPFFANIQINGQPISPPKKISWYPNGLAWELTTSKQFIRKSPEFKKFQNFLVYETEAGNLSRQEAVSMIPPLLLDVQPHHIVLDTCAAPGSKTAQLVESLHSSSSTLIPSGLIIANDSDYKRSHLLVHQSLRRLPSPSTMITNHDASQFPSLSLKHRKLFFDRILCDVPCSGDGTLRKNGGIWKDWTPAQGIGLHGLQLRILSRAISLLKPGGRLVYSTCSLNPLENEAVVSAALSQFPSMSLKDVSDCLPTLIRRPGLTTWTVTTREPENIQPILTSNDAPDQKKYPPTLWPNGREIELGLQRCLRIYPHLQDTGGFFVAVLEKPTSLKLGEVNIQKSNNTLTTPPEEKNLSTMTVKLLNSGLDSMVTEATIDSSSKREILPEEDSVPNGELGRKRLKVERGEALTPLDTEVCHFKEDPYTYLKPDNDELKQCLEYFDVDPSFPVDNLLVRNAEGVPNRTIYLTSSAVREVIENNTHSRLRLICCGLKIFGRQDCPAAKEKNGDKQLRTQSHKWRIISDGVEYFRPFMGSKRLVTCDIEVLRQLMTVDEEYPLFEDLKDVNFRAQVEKLEAGSCVAEVVGEGVPLDLTVGIWVSKASVNLMVDKKERRVLSLRLWGEDITDKSKKEMKTKVETQDENTKIEGEIESSVEGVNGLEKPSPTEADVPNGSNMKVDGIQTDCIPPDQNTLGC